MRTVVPVGSVRCVVFFAMEIGVDPGGVCSVFGLRDFVRLVPVAFGFPPEGGEERWEVCWRDSLIERSAELVEGHGVWDVSCVLSAGFLRRSSGNGPT